MKENEIDVLMFEAKRVESLKLEEKKRERRIKWKLCLKKVLSHVKTNG